MEFGRIVVLRKGNPGATYELDLGEHSIGSAEDCDLRLRLPNGNLLAKHAILKVSPNGVAIIINKSHQAPVTINETSCLKSAVLKHGDIFEIIGKQFQYFNEKLKNEPENSELFVKERNNLLKSNRKSILPLINPDVTYKTKSPNTPEKSLSTRRSVISHRKLSEINLVKERKHSLQAQSSIKFDVNTPKAKRRSSRVNSDISSVQNNNKVYSISSSHSSDSFSSAEGECLQESTVSTTNSDSVNANKEQLANESVVSNNSSVLNNSDTNLQSISRTELDLDLSDFKPISYVTVRDRKRRVRSKSLTVQDIQVISPISTSLSKSLQDAHLSNEDSTVLVTPSPIHKSRVTIKEQDVSVVEISSSLLSTTNVSKTDSRLSMISDASMSEEVHLVLSASLSPKGEITSSEQDTFRNSAVTSVNESAKPISIFDETTQEANHKHFGNTCPEHYEELTSDKNAFGKRMSTFDESTQTANQNGNTFGNTTEEAPTLPNCSQSNGISAEDLSPVKALNSNRNSDILHSSAARRSLRSSVLQSSSLTASLEETTSSALSVSSQSFSMFKRAYSPADDTEIDVVNFTAASELQSGLQVSTRSSKMLVDAESPLKGTPEKRPIFDSGMCTSTPFVKTGVTVQNVKKEVSASVKRRSSLRLSTSKRERHCISCRSVPQRVRSFSLPRVSNVENRKLHSRSVLLPKDSKLTPLKHQVISKRKSEEVCEITLEKSSDVTDETPKSHIKPARRLSKANTSTYNPVVEDITPVTPEIFLDSDRTDGPFKTPINTPGLFESIRESAIRSRKRGRDSHGIILQEENKFKGDIIQESTSPQEEPAKRTIAKRKHKSPQNRLSNFEGVKKLMKTPARSPKNDLTNVPNLRSLMSPRVKRSPKNDLTSVKGVKKLLKSPRPAKDPSNDLTNITGVASLYDTSGVEPLHNDSDAENFDDLFTKLSGKLPVKSYNSRGKSLSLNKVEPPQHNGSSRKTMGDIPDCSPRVHQWVREHAEMNADQSPLPDDDIFNNMSTKPELKHRLARSVSSKKRSTERNSRRKTHGDTAKTTNGNFDAMHVGPVKPSQGMSQRGSENVDDSDDEQLLQSETPAHSSELPVDSEIKNDILLAKNFESKSRLAHLGHQPKEATFNSPVERILQFDSNTTSRRARSLTPTKGKTEEVNRRKSNIAFLNTQSNGAEKLRAAKNIDKSVLNTVSEQPLRKYGTRKSLADIEKSKAEVIIRQSFGGFSTITPSIPSGTFTRNMTSAANKSEVGASSLSRFSLQSGVIIPEENTSFQSLPLPENEYNLMSSSTIDETETAPEDIQQIRTTMQLVKDDKAIEADKNEAKKVVSTRKSSRKVAKPIAEADSVSQDIQKSRSGLQLVGDDRTIEGVEKVISTRRSSRKIAESIADADTVTEDIRKSGSALQLVGENITIDEAKNETEKVVSTRRSSRKVAEPTAETDIVADDIRNSGSVLHLFCDDKMIEEAKNEEVVSARRSTRKVVETIAEADTVAEDIRKSRSGLQLVGEDKTMDEAKNETEKVVSTRRSTRKVAEPTGEADTLVDDIRKSGSALQLVGENKTIDEAKNETEKVVSTRRSSRKVAEPTAETDIVADDIRNSGSALHLFCDDKMIEEAKNEEVVSARRSTRKVVETIAEADTVAVDIRKSRSGLQLVGEDKTMDEAKNETEKVVRTRRSSRKVAEPTTEADTLVDDIQMSGSALQLMGEDKAIDEAKNETDKVASTRRSSRKVSQPTAESDTVFDDIQKSGSALELLSDDETNEEAKNETEKMVWTRRSSRKVSQRIADADTVADYIQNEAKNETEKIVSTRRSSRKVVESIDKVDPTTHESELEQADRALKVDANNENVRSRGPSKKVAEKKSSLQLMGNDQKIDGTKTETVHKVLTRKTSRNVANSTDPTVLRETRNSLDVSVTSSDIKITDNKFENDAPNELLPKLFTDSFDKLADCVSEVVPEVLAISEVTETANKTIEKIPAIKASNKRRPQRAKKTAIVSTDDTDLVGEEILSRRNKLTVPIQDHIDPTIEKNQESEAPIALRRGTRRRVILRTEDIDATTESNVSSTQITEQDSNALRTIRSKVTKSPKPVKTVKKSTRGKNKAINAVIQTVEKVDDSDLKQPNEEKKSIRGKSQKKPSLIESQVEKKISTRSRKEKSTNENKEVDAEHQVESEVIVNESNVRPVRSRKKPNNVKQITEQKNVEVQVIEQTNEEVIESRKPQSNRKKNKVVHFEVDENQEGNSVEVGTRVKTTKRRNAAISEAVQIGVELEPVKKKGRGEKTTKKKETEDNLPQVDQSPKKPRLSIVASRTRSRAKKVEPSSGNN